MIREATLDDVPAIVDMGLQFLRTSDYKEALGENPTQIAATVNWLIADKNGVVLVADYDCGLIGMIGLLIFTHHFSGESIAGELAWWVNPEHRGFGVRLLKAAERWAAERGAERMQMIAPSGEVGRIYERLGYTLVETAYQRNLG